MPLATERGEGMLLEAEPGSGAPAASDVAEDAGKDEASQDWVEMEFTDDEIFVRICKAASKSYKKKGLKQKKEDLFPQLREELAKKRAILQEGLKWPDADTRLSDAYTKAMADLVKDKIGGGPHEQSEYFRVVLAAFPLVYWYIG